MRKFHKKHFLSLYKNKMSVLLVNSTCHHKMVVVSSSSIKTASIIKKKFTNPTCRRKMIVVRKTKFLQKMEARQRVLYALYCAEVGGQKFYYPRQDDFALEVVRGTIDMAQPYYSDYITIYMTDAFKKLSFIPENTPEYYNFAYHHIQRFGGLNHPDLVTWQFAEVMFDDRLSILKSLGHDPLLMNSPEMAAFLTQYRVEADQNYLIKSELLSYFPEEALRLYSDLVMQCVFVATTGSFACFGVGIGLVELLELLSYQKLLEKSGFIFPLAVNAVIAVADPVLVVADPVLAAADAVPFPTVELDTADTGNTGHNNTGNTGSPKPGFPFYSCIFGVLLVGVLIKTIFF